MYSSTIVAALACLSSCAFAAQVEGGFSLRLERRARSDASLARRGNSQGSAEVEAIYQGTDWVTSMKVGGQVLRPQIDTGSGDLWFVSTLVDSATKQKYPTNSYFDPSKSPTWQLQSNYVFNSTYDRGELGAIGIVGTETVELGGVSVTSMAIGAATSIFGEGALDSYYDGVMGLGFGSLQSNIVDGQGNRAGAPTFMQAVQASLSQPVFTLDFRPNVPETINFGFINSQIYTGKMVTQPIDNTTSYWTVNGVTFSSGGKTIGSGGAGIPVIFDSGGLKTTVDAQTASDYWAQVPGASVSQNTFVFPCNTKTLPDLTFHFPTGDTATITGQTLNQTALSNDGVTCAGGLQISINGAFNAGNGFFGTYFTVFNQAEPSLSFAAYNTNFKDTGSGTLNEASLPTSTDAVTGKSGAAKTLGNSVSALLLAFVVASLL